MNVQLAGVTRVVLNLLRYRDDARRPTIMADGVCLNPSTGTGVEYEKEAARPSAASVNVPTNPPASMESTYLALSKNGHTGFVPRIERECVR